MIDIQAGPGPITDSPRRHPKRQLTVFRSAPFVVPSP